MAAETIKKLLRVMRGRRLWKNSGYQCIRGPAVSIGPVDFRDRISIAIDVLPYRRN